MIYHIFTTSLPILPFHVSFFGILIILFYRTVPSLVYFFFISELSSTLFLYFASLLFARGDYYDKHDNHP